MEEEEEEEEREGRRRRQRRKKRACGNVVETLMESLLPSVREHVAASHTQRVFPGRASFVLARAQQAKTQKDESQA